MATNERIFLSSIASLYLMPTISPGSNFLVIAAISLALNTVIANAFSAEAARKRYATAKPIIDRLTGGLLTFFGAKLLLAK